MANDVDAIRRSLLADPADVLSWSAYADWLEEGGFDEALPHVRAFWDTERPQSNLVIRHLRLQAALAPGHSEFCRALSEQQKRDIDAEAIDLIHERQDDLIENEQFASTMAETNASEFNICSVGLRHSVFEAGTCTVEFSFWARGKQDPDRMYYGTNIRGTGIMKVSVEGDVAFTEVRADVDDDGDDFAPDEDE